MVKKIIIFALAFATSFCNVSAVESEIETGDWGLPLIPRAHSYNQTKSNLEFFKLMTKPTGDFILSIQHMSSSGVGGEEISFKPQWAIFKDVARCFGKEKFCISISTDCHLTIMDESTSREVTFIKQNVCFHNPFHVSPDSMHLRFNKDSTSKAIEYDVTYSNGRGSEFAVSKNGTHQHGIILLLDDKDMEIIIDISRMQTDNAVLAMLAQTSLGKNPEILEKIKNIFPADASDFSFIEDMIIKNSAEDEDLLKSLSDAEVNEKITNLELILERYYKKNLSEIKSFTGGDSRYYLSQLSQLALSCLG